MLPVHQVRISVSFSISLEPLNWHPGLHQGGVLQPEERFRGSHRRQEGGLTSPGAADSHDQGGYSIMGSSLGVILSPGGEVKCSKRRLLTLHGHGHWHGHGFDIIQLLHLTTLGF